MNYKKLIISFLITISLAINVYVPNSSASSSETSSLTFMLKDEAEFNEKLREIQRIAPDAEINKIKELYLIETNNLSPAEFSKLNEPSNEDNLVGQLPGIYVETINADTDERNLILSDHYEKFNWGYKRITGNLSEVDQPRNMADVKVAVIDSGIDENHPLLKNHLLKGKTFVEGDSSLADDFGHGTSVSGVITTLAPNVSIVPYKVIGKKDGESMWALQAIVEAVKDDVDVINLSLGTYKSSSKEDEQLIIKAYERAIHFAKKNKVTVVASSGNEGYNLDNLAKEEGKIHLPGGLPNLITVGSTLRNQSIAPYSNFGQEIDVTAPTGYFGENYETRGEINVTEMMLTTFPTSKDNTFIDQAVGLPKGYTLSFGTSLAAPQVSATAALLIGSSLDEGKKINPNRIEKTIYNNAKDLGDKGRDSYFGYGELDIYSTLSDVK
ncbi:S8 family peptidase [Priestia filamentosa]|uniref:S8 family peptidase n=1 Tax=Priestia filamentosa TaxID=1402861 RepID=UPI000E7193F8|nr:S8 family serine peptidase [Priestia filamentosa]RJS65623.1 hypothetical protein CJ485_12995 [Priestia filamentosa]